MVCAVGGLAAGGVTRCPMREGRRSDAPGPHKGNDAQLSVWDDTDGSSIADSAGYGADGRRVAGGPGLPSPRREVVQDRGGRRGAAPVRAGLQHVGQGVECPDTTGGFHLDTVGDRGPHEPDVVDGRA